VGQDTHQSIIELNGHRYDARTGKLLDSLKPKPAKSGPTSMDVRRPHITHVVKPTKSIHKSVQPSRTLMRRAVQKPSVAVKSDKAVSMDVVHAARTGSVESFHQVSHKRLKRAESTPKNSLISRFADFSVPHSHSYKLSETIAPATVPVHQPTPVVSPPAVKAASYAHSKINKVLEKGLRSADSHSKKPIKKNRLHHRIGRKVGLNARAASIAASSVAVLAFGSFFAYQNIPNISVRYAAAKAGVHGGLPGYQPSGFAVSSHVKYSPGIITISYKANADGRGYNLTQKNTDWDSQALKDHIASSNGMTPQIYPDNGRTIYLHGESSADWVAGGVWYSISGNASLNTDQLIKIASSI